MPTIQAMQLPPYHMIVDALKILALPISSSELHGVMCGHLCCGAIKAGETYLRALLTNRKKATIRATTVALFGVYAVSQQQITHFDFGFQLLLPDEEASLVERAQAFSEWCNGFLEGLVMAGFDEKQLNDDEEAHDAIEHLAEFAELAYHDLQVDEDDENALMEVSEYARMAVLRIYSELQMQKKEDNNSAEASH